jgi:2-hydroxychromene-2-carboxylate isomerase
MSEPLEIDVFWSFRSPWSYLATPRLFEWSQQYELSVRLRVVYPIAIRTPDFFSEVNPLWPRYFMIDVLRVAEFLGLPLKWPSPDPVVMEWRDDGPWIPKEQPYIHRLSHLGVLAAERGRGIAFAREVSTLIWTGTPDWHEGGQLAEAVGRVGLDLAELDPIAERERDRLAAVVEQNQVDHEAVGHWGVPTCAFRGEPFFGQDRLDVLLWRLQQHGLQARADTD